MLVREAMTTPVTFIRSGVTLPAAAGVLLTTGVPAAPVLTDDGRLAGIVTELDLLRAMSEPDLRAHEIPVARRGDDVAVVDAVMTRDVVAVVPAMDVDDVVSLMAEEHFNAVPVMDGERLVGLMMRRDVLRLLTHAARSERPHPRASDLPHGMTTDPGRRLP